MFSHSKIETFKTCQYKYYLRYVDKLKTLPDYEADNPLVVGTALHLGIEKGVKNAIEWYKMQFPIMSDKHYEEIIKLENVIPKCKEILPDGVFEEKIENDYFIGFIDLLVPVSEGVFDLYDFKYSNNVKNYLKSGQLHEYKYFYEKITGNKIRKLFYLFAPKVAIRMKKTETQEEFRIRLKNELKDKEPQVIEVFYNPDKVSEFIADVEACKNTVNFNKNFTPLCKWCEYENYCLKGCEIMILPENKRKINENVNYKKMWFYGLPFSGKTYLANKFDDVLMLNTDGNVKYVDAPFIPIKDNVTVTGRITNVKKAWEVFKETVLELEKKQNDFKTIVVDLLEDVYEHCRLWCYDELEIEHESDNSFKAWDFVRTEFLSVIRKLINLDYNIILISHEDSSKDIMRKFDKITAIKPNISDKIALKIAGMVDVVGRIINENGNRIISFKSNEVIFGGGRLNLNKLEIPCEYDDLLKIYKDVVKPVVKENLTAEPEKKVEPILDENANVKETVKEEEIEVPIDNTNENVVRTRRTRRTREV